MNIDFVQTEDLEFVINTLKKQVGDSASFNFPGWKNSTFDILEEWRRVVKREGPLVEKGVGLHITRPFCWEALQDSLQAMN